MSRSYRKAIVTDQQKQRTQNKKSKRLANKRVRNSEDVSDGKSYKRISCSYNICDSRSKVEYQQNIFKDEEIYDYISGKLIRIMSVEEKMLDLKKARRK